MDPQQLDALNQQTLAAAGGKPEAQVSVITPSDGPNTTPESTLQQQIAALQRQVQDLAAQAAAQPTDTAPVPSSGAAAQDSQQSTGQSASPASTPPAAPVAPATGAPGEFTSAQVQTPAADAAAAQDTRRQESVVNKIETIGVKIVSESGAAVEDVRKTLDAIGQVRSLAPGQAVDLPPVPLDEFGAKYELTLSVKRVS